MIAFADLLERLTFSSDPPTRIALLRRYFETQPDPERGVALGILTRAVRPPTLRPAALRRLVADRCDVVLFDLSLEYVGDISETVALIWPPSRRNAPPPTLTDIVNTVRADLPTAVVGWLDSCDGDQRLALLKLVTGGFRSLVTGSEIRAALGGAAVEEVWHAQTPPYLALFAWLEGRGSRPRTGGFHPLMRAGRAGPGDFLAEPLWEGERVLISDGRVFSRHADDVSDSYPEFRLGGVVLDGVVTREPRCLRLFDLLFDGVEDLRHLGFTTRRARLEAWFDRVRPAGAQLSPFVEFGPGDAGLILKHIDSPYVAGAEHAFWVTRPHPTRTIAAVLLYTEAGRYTVGLWRDGMLVPIGQATSEVAAVDIWVRDHTVARYGPVREVEKALVVAVTFNSIRAASRRKAGVVLQDARIVAVQEGATADDLDVLGTGV